MECVIYRRGKPAGTLTMEADGLYWRFTGVLDGGAELLRLYAPEKIGVFVPEGAQLICRRRISRTQLQVLPEWAAAWCEADGHWSAEEAGLLVRYTPTGREEAIRWEAPMRFPAAPTQLKLIMLADAPHLCRTISYGNL